MPDVRSEALPVAAEPLKETFCALFLAAFAGPAMLIAGAMICLTGVKSFAGVPLLVGGVLTPFFATAVGLTSCGKNLPGSSEPSGDGIGDEALDGRARGARLAVDGGRIGAAA
jgi:hypothetical protein